MFHWKQAIRRRLIALGFTPQIITFIIGADGVMNMLTVIPTEEMREGIRWVRAQVNETADKEKWDTFWEYFWATWCVRYNPLHWNVHKINADPSIELLNRTNNPLERFNRRFNAAFPNSTRPSIVAYVATILQISNDVIADLALIRLGKLQPHRHQPATTYTIPATYPLPAVGLVPVADVVAAGIVALGPVDAPVIAGPIVLVPAVVVAPMIAPAFNEGLAVPKKKRGLYIKKSTKTD